MAIAVDHQPGTFQRMTTKTREPLWKVDQAAAFLNYKPETLYKKVRAGQCRYVVWVAGGVSTRLSLRT